MNLKSILKSLKLNESTISMLLGILVIVVAGVLLVNFFRDQNSGTTLPTGEVTENTEENGPTIVRDGKTYHVVQENESLWSVAERYYKSGYNWVDIAEVNELTNSDSISEGQELLIPDVEAKLATVIEVSVTPEATATATVAATATPEETSEVTASVTPAAEKPTEAVTITDGSYTVVKGDSLWDIATRAYGDGYKWVDIARENKLVNPNVIHPGNVLTLPR